MKFLLTASFLSLVHAHIYLTYPASRMPTFPGVGIDAPSAQYLKHFPCGQDLGTDTVYPSLVTENMPWPGGVSANQTNNFDRTITPLTSLKPGLNVIQFNEAIGHIGAPFRVAFSYGDDFKFDQYVIADHIPNANGQSGDYYEVSINIPDVSCSETDKCVIQLQQVMTDKFAAINKTECANPLDQTMCGFVGGSYFNCANVLISGSQPVSSLKPFYQDSSVFPNPRKPYLIGEHAKYIKNANNAWVLENSNTQLSASCQSDISQATLTTPSSGESICVVAKTTPNPAPGVSMGTVLAIVAAIAGLMTIGYIVFAVRRKNLKNREGLLNTAESETNYDRI